MQNSEIVKKVRLALGISGAELARKMGMSQQYVQQVESKKASASEKFMAKLWHVVDDYNLRGALEDDPVIVMYKALPPDKQRVVADVIRMAAGTALAEDGVDFKEL